MANKLASTIVEIFVSAVNRQTLDAQDPNVLQIAVLYFDAKRYHALPTVLGWLDACQPDQQAGIAWQALNHLLRETEPADPAQALHHRLLELLAEIETDLTQNTEWQTQQADARARIAQLAEVWLIELMRKH